MRRQFRRHWRSFSSWVAHSPTFPRRCRMEPAASASFWICRSLTRADHRIHANWIFVRRDSHCRGQLRHGCYECGVGAGGCTPGEPILRNWDVAQARGATCIDGQACASPDSQGPWDTPIHRAALLACIWAGFLTGALLSGAATPHFGAWVLLFPIMVLLALTALDGGRRRPHEFPSTSHSF